MDNSEDWEKPNTFGEAALRSLEGVLDQLRSRDWRGGPPAGQAAALPGGGGGGRRGGGPLGGGERGVCGVGADVGECGEIEPERARLGGQAGHELFGRIREL